MLLMIAVVVLVLGVVIMVHELGHYIAAKAVGIQVLRFSIGFGPPLLSWRRGETEYWIAAVPLGGYVKMAGLEEDEELTGRLEGGASSVPIDPNRTLESKPVWARLLVMVAGVTMNVVLAYMLHVGIRVTGQPEPAMVPIDSVAVDSLPQGARGLARLEPGALIVRVNGDTVRTWNEFNRHVMSGPDTLRLALAGRDEPLVVGLPPDTGERRRAWETLVPRVPPAIGLLIPGDPAYRAGLEAGDVVLHVNQDSVRWWSELVTLIRRSPGDTLRMTVLRGDETHELLVVPRLETVRDSGGVTRSFGLIGAQPNPPVVRVRQPLGQALVGGFAETVVRTGAVLSFLKGLVVREVSLRDVGGPVLIAQLSGQAARLGLATLLSFVAFISLNLAVLNLLPIPVLDGGHVMFLLIEAVRGKPVGLGVRLRLTQVGFVLLMLLMILAISNDVFRLFGR